MTSPAVGSARAAFPRGLSQPDSGFRFSLDALLLASFAGRERVRGRVLDLGTGCGVVGLAMALDHPDFFGLGLDANPDMPVHARRNALSLGFGHRFAFVQGDVRCPGCLKPESMDLVVCNPPYREPGTGRVCPDAGRSGARFEGGAVLADFVRAASFLVRNKKPCVFIHLAERLDDLLALMLAARLRPKETLFIHPRSGSPARLVLVRALKNGGASMAVPAPLVLHGDEGGDTRLTEQALRFCPRLACNPGGAGNRSQGKKNPA